VTLAPVAVMEKRDGVWVNPDTGDTAEGLCKECVLGAAQGKGNIMFFGDDDRQLVLRGRDMLTRMYDLSRKSGARRAVAEFLSDVVGYTDCLVGRALPPSQMDKSSIFAEARHEGLTPIAPWQMKLH